MEELLTDYLVVVSCARDSVPKRASGFRDVEDEREELEIQIRAVPEIERRIAELEAGGEGS